MGEIVARVTSDLPKKLTYKKGVTHSATGVDEVLRAGGGVCQDFAHLAIALLRRAGVPTRYVSGYLHRAGGGAELETHAWCEAHTGRGEWVAFDPTHSQVADEQHIAVAVGRSYTDVPPNRGVYRGNASEEIDVVVTIEEVSEVPLGLLAPRTAPIEAPTYMDGPRQHHEQLDYQQEQQQQQ